VVFTSLYFENSKPCREYIVKRVMKFSSKYSISNTNSTSIYWRCRKVLIHWEFLIPWNWLLEIFPATIMTKKQTELIIANANLKPIWLDNCSLWKLWNCNYSTINLVFTHYTINQWFPGQQIPIQITILCFIDHQIILNGLPTGKIWEPLL